MRLPSFTILGLGTACTIPGFFTLVYGLSSVGTPDVLASRKVGAIVFPIGLFLLGIAACRAAVQSHRQRRAARRGFDVLPAKALDPDRDGDQSAKDSH
jgi:hypothetical protein